MSQEEEIVQSNDQIVNEIENLNPEQRGSLPQKIIFEYSN